jgi:hypothetical protein
MYSFIYLFIKMENMNRFLSNSILKNLYEKNTTHVQKKIQKIIKNGPSLHDGPGEVYGYQKNIKYINNNYYIKIGMSINADYRVIKQWKAEIVFKLYTPFRRLTEGITHLLLDYCRKKLVLENDKEQIEWFYINCNEDPLIIVNYVSRFSNIYSKKIYTDNFELDGIKYNKILDYNEKQNGITENDITENNNNQDVIEINDSDEEIYEIKGIDKFMKEMDINRHKDKYKDKHKNKHKDNTSNNIIL